MNDRESERAIADSRIEKHTVLRRIDELNELTPKLYEGNATVEVKTDYANTIKGLETLSGITEIAARVYSAKTKAVEQEKKQEQPQQKK